MKASFLFLSVVLFGLLLNQAPTAESAACNPSELISCAPSIRKGSPPSSTCCAKLKSQQACLCQYKKNPNYSGYFNSGNGRSVLSSCGVTVPRC